MFFSRNIAQSFRGNCIQSRSECALRRSSVWRSGTYSAFGMSTLWLRGKKTKTRVKLSDLPQGPLQADPLLAESGPITPAYPTVVLQARQHMDKFDNCVLLTRVGGFYELYFENAEEYAPLLNLKLASKKTSAGPVPMAGFPFFQLERYLKILVQDLNRYVAVAEEVRNDAAAKLRSGGLIHDRRVARVITPGTLIDENFIDPYVHNYVMAIYAAPETLATEEPEAREDFDSEDTVCLGLAWLDLSTGQFFTQSTDLDSLSAILSRINPREIVLHDSLAKRQDHRLFSILAEDRHLITFAPQETTNSVSDWTPMLESEVKESVRKSFSASEIHSGSLLLSYVQDRLQGLSMKLHPPQRHNTMQIMSIDKNSSRALEIKQTMRDGYFRGSLLHSIRRTVTKSGARLLNDWLSSPSTSIETISSRQDVVARFIDSEDLRDTIVSLLRRSHDSQRLVQKFAMSRGDADDLLALASTIRAAKEVLSILEQVCSNVDRGVSNQDCFQPLISRLDLREPLKLADRIREAIDEEGIIQQHEVEDSETTQMLALAQDIVVSEGFEGDSISLNKSKKKRPASIRESYAEDSDAWIMKPAASLWLTRLHESLVKLLNEKEALSQSLRARLKAPSLTLRWSPGLSHFAHVKGKDTKHLNTISTLSASLSTRSFHLPEWTALGQRLDHIRSQIRLEEKFIFQSLREHVVHNLVKLRRNASVLDELDITTSFAKLATEQNLTRPKLNNSTAHTIIGGRHPTVEVGLVDRGRSFVDNDCLVGNPASGCLWIITGPNMAGKSTFLRQNALITILAQIGCYVPATYAEIGIVDAIYSRVGSADNLYRDQSTFMVEMLETAQILKQATSRSFVIMDEIGRGTTPEDGTAISFACLHHLVTINKCRTLFATHFHAVVGLSVDYGLSNVDGQGAVQTFCTDVEEEDCGSFYYDHKLRKGVNRESHALKVARLAGLPNTAIRMAGVVLQGKAIDSR